MHFDDERAQSDPRTSERNWKRMVESIRRIESTENRKTVNNLYERDWFGFIKDAIERITARFISMC